MTNQSIPAQRYLRNTRRVFDDPANVERCLKLFTEGVTPKQLAARFDVPIYQVYREINNAGVRYQHDYPQLPLTQPPPTREPCPCCGVRADIGCGHTVRW